MHAGRLGGESTHSAQRSNPSICEWASAMTSKLPPVIESGVFTASVQRTIDAPIERVWDVLTDLPKYHEWSVSSAL